MSADLTPVVTINGNVVYALQPRQMEALNLTPLRRLPDEPGPTRIGYGGAAGGGKSYLARAVAALTALTWPGSSGIIFRRTHQEVVDNHIVKIRQELAGYEGKLFKLNEGSGTMEWANGSRTRFGYLERDDHVYRYQGPEYDLMIPEEATHYTWFMMSWLMNNRLRSSVPGTRPFVLFPTNPGNIGHHWFKRLFVDRRYEASRGEQPEDYAFVRSFVRDNAVLMERDPAYIKRLEQLPEPYRSWLLEGDFHAGAGQALVLDRDAHMVEPFQVPEHWHLFGGHDWGFQHPFVWGLYASDEAGSVYKLATVRGRHLQDAEIVERVEAKRAELVADGILSERHATATILTHAGHDVWTERKARAEAAIPTSAETYRERGWPCIQANIARIAGLKNLRAYLRYTASVPPRFRWFRSEDNEASYDRIETMVSDPDNPEDVLKVDADPYGDGGDDDYDELRYALASRPLLAREPVTEGLRSAWDPEALAAEMEQRRVRTVPPRPRVDPMVMAEIE